MTGNNFFKVKAGASLRFTRRALARREQQKVRLAQEGNEAVVLTFVAPLGRNPTTARRGFRARVALSYKF